MLFNIFIVIQLVSAISLIALVYFQPSKSGDAGGAFSSGGGSAQAQASMSSYDFLTKLTFCVGMVFLFSSLTVVYIGKKQLQEANKVEVVVPVGDLPSPNSNNGQVQEKSQPMNSEPATPAVPAPAVSAPAVSEPLKTVEEKVPAK